MTKTMTLSVLLFLYLAAFIFNTFFPSDTARYLMVAILAGVHFLAFGGVKRASGLFSVVLTILGALLMFGSGATTDDWVNAWLNNAPVICLLLTVSLFTIPLYFEPYHEALSMNVTRFAKSPFQFYALTLGLTTALASLLNVASFPFVHSLLKETAAKYRDGVIARALSRAIAINMFWSPASISLAVVIQYSDLSWFEILPSTILLALAAYLVALVFGAVEFRGTAQVREEGANNSSAAILGKLFLQLAIMMVFIALLQYFTHKSALVTVPLVSFAGPLLLAVVFSRLRVWAVRFGEYFRTSLPNSCGEVILFTSFGFFGYALGLSDIKDYVPLAIQYLGFDSPLSLIPLITFLTAFPSLFGVHPLITISTMAIALPPGSVALTKIQMAGALLMGYVCYVNLSPFSAVSLVLLGLTKGDPIKDTIRQNWPYSVAVTAAATAILTYFF